MKLTPSFAVLLENFLYPALGKAATGQPAHHRFLSRYLSVTAAVRSEAVAKIAFSVSPSRRSIPRSLRPSSTRWNRVEVFLLAAAIFA